MAKSLEGTIKAGLKAAMAASFAERTPGPGGLGKTEEVGAWKPVAVLGCESLELRVFSHWPLRPSPFMTHPSRSFQIRVAGEKPWRTDGVTSLGAAVYEIVTGLAVVQGFAALAAA